MAIRPFLAMTAAEMHNCTAFPSRIAWMACHFSPGGSGLSNLPPALPEDALLIVNDSTPIHGHDPEEITRQLIRCIRDRESACIVLDFQRPDHPETAELVKYLSHTLPVSPVVSEFYAVESDGPVLLSPLPLSVPLEQYLSGWKNREIWLDLGCWGEVLTLTEAGCESTPLPPWDLPEQGFPEEKLHCHYQIHSTEQSAEFVLWRTEADLFTLLEESEALGVANAVGLFQELHAIFS